MTKAIGSSVGHVLVRGEDFRSADRDMTWTSLSWTERTDTPSEMEKLSLSSGEHPRPVIDKLESPPTPKRWF